jgi:general secretion pathway protein M
MKTLNLNSILAPLLSMMANLRRRERLAVIAAACALVLFLVMQVLVFPIFDKRTRLHAQISAKQVNLKEIQVLKAEYQTLSLRSKGADEQLKKRPKSFTLFSFLDNLAGKSGIKKNIVYMKPSTTNLKNSPYVLSIVEMKIQSLTMEQLLTLLYGVETSGEQVWIKRMSLSKGEKKEGLINATLQVETYQL